MCWMYFSRWASESCGDVDNHLPICEKDLSVNSYLLLDIRSG